MTKELQERDKPFILALISMGSLLSVLFTLIYLKQYEMLKEVVAWFSPWVSMSWAFYFKAKS